ncbi:MAG: hypothetical protein KKF52_00910 [Nanoarchaeota archaeon]|nr:hypothetical protein [Nanoarchaeota archaeon]
MLEQKLKNVKARLLEELGQKEMESSYCYDRICELMTEEGVIKGKYKNKNWLKDAEARDETLFSARFRGYLEGKKDLKNIYGINFDYIVSKKTKLSPRTKEDIDHLERIKKQTEEYLKKTVGKNEILEETYEKLVENFLLNETNLPELVQDEDRKRTIVVRVYAFLHYKLNLKIKKPSKVVLGHKEEDLDNILKRI